ncbi:STAS domain-containing protein [Domibacillus iocasae]|uniref:RsbR, positive regulator of sigma-B n=1 Tax=Domibacillus iocasae TaxID=1714016 RepID=A0A1E7DR66_9BACI|nr:STAS domain-containing protein [Domibacillus iocasae]OES45553.1 RsbR, positive regulator of sigma-B [Domibacillus iocasae]
MNALGHIPEHVSAIHVLNSVGENILIADTTYTIQWMNANAANLLSIIAPLYGLTRADDIIGMNMDHFHASPKRQQAVMKSLQDSHRTRITIKDRIVTDIVITPMRDGQGHINGYIVLLTDVTTKAEEEAEKEKLIHALSVPILHIWEKTISLPLIGEFDTERADRMIISVLEECTQHRIQYVLLDLSGLFIADDAIHHHIQKLTNCLQLIGAECIMTGIKPQLAQAVGRLEQHIQTFQTAHAGLQYIIQNKKRY